jgi:hypothetical protein
MAASAAQLAAKWRAAARKTGGPAAAPGVDKLMARIALRESAGKRYAQHLNTNGTIDRGFWQINSIWGNLSRFHNNASSAVHVFNTQGPKAWATYNPAIDKKYLSGLSSGQAAAKVAGRATAMRPGTLKIKGNFTPAREAPDMAEAVRMVLSRQGDKLPSIKSDPLSQIVGLYRSGQATSPIPASYSQKITSTPSRAGQMRAANQPSAPSSAGSGKGKFVIFGANPERLKPAIVSFARQVAAVAGETLHGDSGATHSKFTVDGNVSQHWTGDATDIPATGTHLIHLGQAALIAAGMPRKQALQQHGGLYNVGGRQIIFNTHIGGDHTNHLHLGD